MPETLRGEVFTETHVRWDPPHDPTAEEAVLGALLVEDCLPRVMVHTRPADFYTGAHRVMMEAAVALWEKAETIDVVTWANELKAKGTFEEAGGMDRLSLLIEAVPTAANVEHHAKIVSSHARRRELIEAIKLAEAAAYTGEDSEVSTALHQLIEAAGPKHGSAGFRMVKESLWASLERIEAMMSGERDSGLRTGFRDLDRVLIGIQPGNMIVVAARPSMGKTAFALNVLTNVGLGGTPVALVSLEMSTAEVTERMIAAEARIDMQAVRNGHTLPKEAHARIATVAGHLNSAPIYIDDQPHARLPELSAKLQTLVQKDGVKLIVVDYLQLMEADAENRTQEVSKLSRGLKNLARKLGVPIIVLSQLSRALESRADKRPMLSDLRDSGAIEQDADVVCFLYRPEYYERDAEALRELSGDAEIIVAKQRNGPTGAVPMHFHKAYTRFEDLDRSTTARRSA